MPPRRMSKRSPRAAAPASRRRAARTDTATSRRRAATTRAAVPAVSPYAAAFPPPFRRLNAYAFDPSLSMQMDTAMINELVLRVPWESQLEPGPVGEYVEVVDVDPSSGAFYDPIDLNDPVLLAQDGLPPSEGYPQFHQQMVYAVAMTTIRNFERVLGRKVFWSPRLPSPSNPEKRDYVQRLRIYPHALREANAYYSPDKKALLFGYFTADESASGATVPGSTVFTCLSHDIVAHETTHALLDGLHRRWIEPTHEDGLAFHEAFADIVALFQHFTFPEVLRQQIASHRGDLASQSLLGELAQEFGAAIGHRGALRSALGSVDRDTGVWTPHKPDPTAYARETEPHARGSLLVAAVFQAFLAIYRSRVADLFRIATGGTGVLPQGAIHPDLVHRLAVEAAKSAQHVLNMCVRALDYCPPVGLTFGEYLRALVTADFDVVPDDDRRYRLAFIDAFRAWGLYPRDVRSLSVDSLRWQQVADKPESARAFVGVRDRLYDIWRKNLRPEESRHEMWRRSRAMCAKMHDVIKGLGDDELRQFEDITGLSITPRRGVEGFERRSGLNKFEVHDIRPARRAGPDGDVRNQMVLSITQKRRVRIDPNGPDVRENQFWFRGGSTLVLDLDSLQLEYAIRKRVTSESRLQRNREFLGGEAGVSLRATYFGRPLVEDEAEPLALLHRTV